MSSNKEVFRICIHCGANFIAKTVTTKYCSTKCSQHAFKQRMRDTKASTAVEVMRDKTDPPLYKSKKNTQISNLSGQNPPTLICKEYLSVYETSRLLGVCRATINKYCVSGKLKCVKMNRKIFIRRSDIDEMFETAPVYEVTPKVIKTQMEKVTQTRELDTHSLTEPITDFYSAEEAAEKFGVTKGAIRHRANSNDVPWIIFQKLRFYSKNHLDKLYENEGLNSSVIDWCNIETIMDEYKMTQNAVYSFVSTYKIPRRKVNGKNVYSKPHLDERLKAKLGDQTIDSWYTKNDITEKYGLKPHYIANFVFTHKIPKKRLNNEGYYSKEHFDAAIKEKNPPTVYLTIEGAAEYFSLSQEKIHSLIRKHDIPKTKDGKLVRVQKIELDKFINASK